MKGFDGCPLKHGTARVGGLSSVSVTFPFTPRSTVRVTGESCCNNEHSPGSTRVSVRVTVVETPSTVRVWVMVVLAPVSWGKTSLGKKLVNCVIGSDPGVSGVRSMSTGPAVFPKGAAAFPGNWPSVVVRVTLKVVALASAGIRRPLRRFTMSANRTAHTSRPSYSRSVLLSNRRMPANSSDNPRSKDSVKSAYLISAKSGGSSQRSRRAGSTQTWRSVN